MTKLLVGQTLWFVGNPFGYCKNRQGEVTVTEVGRKWATIAGAHHGRIDKETLKVDGGQFSSLGNCYLSQQAWLETEGCKLAWQQLRSSLPSSCPPNLAYDDIVQLGKRLGLDVRVMESGSC